MECPAPTVLASPHNVRNPSRPAISRPSTFFCAFLTLLNDRLGESIVFPLLPFLLSAGAPALMSSIGITALALFAVGATISLFTGRSAIRDGLRMLGIGALAGLLTYAIGTLLGVSLG